LLVSLVFHVLLALLAAFYLSVVAPPIPHEAKVDVEFVTLTNESQRTSPRQKVLPRNERAVPTVQSSPIWRRTESPVPLAIVAGSREIKVAANPIPPTFSATIPVLDTAARLPATSVGSLSALQGTPTRPTPGRGLLAGVQRPAGSGFGGNIVNSTGASNTSLMPGNSRLEGTGPSVARAKLPSASPFAEPLMRIGESIAEGSPSGKADVVFVVDSSGSMVNNIRQVANNLFEMSDALDTHAIDYQLGVVEFNETASGVHVQMGGLTRDTETLRQKMSALAVTGNERALDALVQTISLTRFRGDSDHHLVLVTDEPVTTRWTDANALKQRVIADAKRADIKVQVLGYRELFQRQLATQTGGVFVEIPGGQASSKESGAVSDDSTVLMHSDELEETFRRIGTSIAKFVRPDVEGSGGLVDVALFVDYSASMQGRLRAVMGGVSALSKTLELRGLDYAIVICRFAQSAGLSGSGVEGVSVSPLLTDVNRIQQLLSYPAGGDELVYDSVAAGIKRVPYRKGAQRVAVIVTDEPPVGKNTSSSAFVDAIEQQGVRFYAVCAVPPSIPKAWLPKPPANDSSDGLVRAVASTSGELYEMPQSLPQADPKR
jgi:Mg-chelatase subunit ChlD